MMLSEIQALLGTLVDTDWTTRRTDQGKKVALYRNYADGHHRHDFTPEMKAMLRITGEFTFILSIHQINIVATFTQHILD